MRDLFKLLLGNVVVFVDEHPDCLSVLSPASGEILGDEVVLIGEFLPLGLVLDFKRMKGVFKCYDFVTLLMNLGLNLFSDGFGL